MRLFTAIDLPEDIRQRYADLQTPGTLDARWTSPSQFHVTLRFIGDVDASSAPRYENALTQVEEPTVQCTPYGLDVLPSRRNPSVLVVGLRRSDSLLSVYEAVSTALREVDLPPEDRTYRPHVTLARLNGASPESVHELLDAYGDAQLPSFTADRFYLYESTLTPNGAVHERRASFELGSSDPNAR